MTEVGNARKYLYFSERRVRRWLEESGITVSEPGQQEFATPSFGNTAPTFKWTRNSKTPIKHRLAELFERKFSDLVVKDMQAPGPIRFATGIGLVNFGEFVIDSLPVRALIHVKIEAADDATVAVCLFGSLDNYAEFMPIPGSLGGFSWTSSAAPDIERFLETRSLEKSVLCDTREDLAREVLKVALFQGDRGPYHDHTKGYNRRFTYGETNETAEWCAEIYWDVNLAKTDCGPEAGFSRVLIGAPLWVRTPSLRSIHLYPEYSVEEIERIHKNSLNAAEDRHSGALAFDSEKLPLSKRFIRALRVLMGRE